MNGFPESYVIDLDSFKYRHEYKFIVGVYEDMLSVGDMYHNDVIGKTLETIDTALDAKYWQYMSGYVAQNICASGSNAHLSTWQANIIQALKAYPSYKKAVLPAGEFLFIFLIFFDCSLCFIPPYIDFSLFGTEPSLSGLKLKYRVENLNKISFSYFFPFVPFMCAFCILSGILKGL